MPNAPAHHAIDEMSPTVEFKKSYLTKEQKKTLTKMSKVLKRPAALNKRDKFLVVGGDNSVECEISRVKGQLRRKNMLGRMSPAHSHVQQLAAKRLLENPGLHSVLEAFAMYRQDRKNLLNAKPMHCYDINEDHSWML